MRILKTFKGLKEGDIFVYVEDTEPNKVKLISIVTLIDKISIKYKCQSATREKVESFHCRDLETEEPPTLFPDWKVYELTTEREKEKYNKMLLALMIKKENTE